MPVIPALLRGPCAACAAPIEAGELIAYTLADGAKHLACTDRASIARRNLFRTECHACGTQLRKGQGSIEVVERQKAPGVFERTWIAYCVDVSVCAERLHLAPPSRSTDG